MAGIPFMPLYVGDYMSDAAHLTCIEHGAYLQLIMTYWRHGKPLPNDDRKLARICGLTSSQWARIKLTILDFFRAEEITENGIVVRQLRHSRVDTELAKAADKSLKRRKGGLARAEQMLSTSTSGAKVSQNQISESGEELEPSSVLNRENISTLHAFAGRTIRLTARDMGAWEDRYHAIADLRAELGSLDDWISGQDEVKRKGWFHVVSGALNKKHQAALRDAKAIDDDGLEMPVC